jgi:hypothetical protein
VFLQQLDQFVQDVARHDQIPRSAVRFTRRQLRVATKCADFAMRKHLHKLEQLEYVLAHRGRNGQRYVYELIVDYSQLDDETTGLLTPVEAGERPPSRPAQTA